jgi:hypothetical protein
VLAKDGTWRAELALVDWRRSLAPALMASVGVLLAVAVLLFVRRLSGALIAPLAAAPLIATATGLSAWAVAVQIRFRDERVKWATLATVILFAVACSFPGARLIDWLVWPIALAAVWVLPSRLRLNSQRRSVLPPDNPADQPLQELTRSRSANGVEAVLGKVVAEFAANERSAVVHVAFCPPFEQLPAVEIRRTTGPACEVKVAQLLHQGVRFELRLSRASTEPLRVTIEFTATGQPPAAVSP